MEIEGRLAEELPATIIKCLESFLKEERRSIRGDEE
jgi:hypothetical protein